MKEPKLSIIVLDKGFVYVGYFHVAEDGTVIIREGHNLRVWGTTDGLGQLALHGPIKDKTIMDKVTNIVAPYHALNHVMSTDPEKWPQYRTKAAKK